MNNQNSGIIPYTIQPNDVLWKIAEKFNTTVYAIAVLNPGMDINQLRIGENIFVWPGLGANIPSIIPTGEESIFTRSEVELNKLLRMLWQQSAAWMRRAAMTQIYDLPEYPTNVKRLLRTARDIEQTLRRYYTASISMKFGTLMTELLQLMLRMATSLKNKNAEETETARQLALKKADEIAEYLASINSYWKKETWQELLYQYIQLFAAQVEDTINNRYVESVDEFNQAEINAYTIADYMTNGIIVKFRDLFR